MAAAPAAQSTPTLVPKPPAAVEPRLAINAPPPAAHSGPQRVIPIRNLAPTAPKKKNPLVTYGVGALVLIGLAVGGYYGYAWMNGMQDKVNTSSKEAAKNADGGQVGHIANLYGTLDATDPSKAPVDTRSTGPRQRRTGVGQEIPVSGAADSSAAGTNSMDSLPLIPAVWTLDLTKARIPSGRVNGSIAGTNFLPETARIDAVGNAQVLRIVQGQPFSPDREILVYLHLKPGEKIGGQTLNVPQDMAGTGVPQVKKGWRNNPKFAPQYKSFSSGYAMRLELGQLADGALAGKIFLSLPDADQSVVAGNFKATLTTNVVVDAAAQAQAVQMQAVPVTAPANTSASDAAWQARYGTRRSQ